MTAGVVVVRICLSCFMDTRIRSDPTWLVSDQYSVVSESTVRSQHVMYVVVVDKVLQVDDII